MQPRSGRNMGMNVQSAWLKGYTGKGIVVVHADSGIDYKHADLWLNYDPYFSTDLGEEDSVSLLI